MAKILIVDDDDQLLAVLAGSLRKEGYLIELCYSKEEAEENLRLGEYDLLVLDLGLPDGSGFDICRDYRARGGTARILMLTGQSAERDKELGLDLGADDYLTKPFGFRELAARIRALLRRAAPIASDNVEFANIKLDLTNKRMYRDGSEVHLQPLDFAVLAHFARHQGQVLTQEALLNKVWGTYTESGVEALRAAVKRIRKEIDREGQASMIETVHRVGYCFRPC